jgi:hypothetical protein
VHGNEVINKKYKNGGYMEKLKVKNKKEFTNIIKKYRDDGYMLITYGKKLAELEKDNEIIIIEF